MKVLFDHSAFVMQACGGVSRVLYELFRHVAQENGIEGRLFAGVHRNRYLRDAPAEIKKKIIGWYLPEWLVKQRVFIPINNILFSLYAQWYQPDICHYTYLYTPRVPRKCKKIITLHDMIPELYPNLVAPNDRQQRWKQKAISHANGITCVSENTKKDLTRFFDLKEVEIQVIHNGNSLSQESSQQLELPRPYFLYVGTRNVEYKNFTMVLEAMATYSKKEASIHLICFGGGPFNRLEMQRIRALHLENRVLQIAGDDAVLAGCYKSAQALIYPSLYEGFGLPPVEAMALRCPVICSDAAPMPEIVGDAALTFDAHSETTLVERMNEIEHLDTRRTIIQKGLRRAPFFSWTRSGKKLIAFYNVVLRAVKNDTI